MLGNVTGDFCLSAEHLAGIFMKFYGRNKQRVRTALPLSCRIGLTSNNYLKVGVNALTADDECFRHNTENLPQLEKVLLVRSEILGLLVNTLTADDQYFCHNRENIPLPIQMRLSKTPKTFCCFVIAILKFTLNFEHFFKRVSLIA